MRISNSAISINSLVIISGYSLALRKACFVPVTVGNGYADFQATGTLLATQEIIDVFVFSQEEIQGNVV
jgi:hypothetical protein